MYSAAVRLLNLAGQVEVGEGIKKPFIVQENLHQIVIANKVTLLTKTEKNGAAIEKV